MDGRSVLPFATVAAQRPPADRSACRRLGSLSAPPCSRRLIWTVFGQAIPSSRQQCSQFAELFPMNARPLQLLNRGFLLKMLQEVPRGNGRLL